VYSCSIDKDSQKRNQIIIYVNADNLYSINDRLIPKDKLKLALSDLKDKIANSGTEPDQIEIVLEVDKRASRYSLSKLEAILRELHLKKIRLRQKTEPNNAW
jgi:biopolymer transport protein ExbD